MASRPCSICKILSSDFENPIHCKKRQDSPRKGISICMSKGAIETLKSTSSSFGCHLIISPSTYLSIHSFLHLPSYLSIIYLSIRPCIYLSLYVFPSLYPCKHATTHISIRCDILMSCQLFNMLGARTSDNLSFCRWVLVRPITRFFVYGTTL